VNQFAGQVFAQPMSALQSVSAVHAVETSFKQLVPASGDSVPLMQPRQV
jgi:hypothetical protein